MGKTGQIGLKKSKGCLDLWFGLQSLILATEKINKGLQK